MELLNREWVPFLMGLEEYYPGREKKISEKYWFPMPNTIMIFGRVPRKQTGHASLFMLALLLCGFFVSRLATTFYRLPQLTLMFAKLKEHLLPKDEFLKNGEIAKNKGNLCLYVKKYAFISVFYVSWTNIC